MIYKVGNTAYEEYNLQQKLQGWKVTTPRSSEVCLREESRSRLSGDEQSGVQLLNYHRHDSSANAPWYNPRAAIYPPNPGAITKF